MAHSFRTAAEILFGRGVSAGLGARVGRFAERVILFHGATAVRAEWLANELDAAGIAVARVAVAAEPDVALVEAATIAARDHGAGAVVALGGGAVIDAGKAVAALAPAPGGLMAHLEIVGAGRPLEAAPLPFVAVPTTAGTGAEVTANAVISVPQARRKVSLRDDRMLADLAVVDPALTDGCPGRVTLASGLDAVTQVIEPYLSSRANRLTDALARDAIPAGLAALARLMTQEDPDARDTMSHVSLAGGLCLANAGLGAVHGLAGPVGGVSGAPHGAVCGALLPHVLAANAAAGADPARIAELRGLIAAAVGPDLAGWARDHGLPGLGEMGLARADIAAVAEAAEGSSSMRSNPVRLDRAALVRCLEAAY